jgi:hypothetical protein
MFLYIDNVWFDAHQDNIEIEQQGIVNHALLELGDKAENVYQLLLW